MYNHLTAPHHHQLQQQQQQHQQQALLQQTQHHHHQQQQQQQQHDIYTILSTDMPDDAPIDTAELVKDIFDSSDFTTPTPTPATTTATTPHTANNNTAVTSSSINSSSDQNKLSSSSTTTSSTTTTTSQATQSSVPTSTDFSFSHDFINFDMNQQYTPSTEIYNDPFLSTLHGYRETEPRQDFGRRHSVAVSGGIADLNNRFQSMPTYGMTTSILPMTRKAQTLPTVMEQQPPMTRFNNSLDPPSTVHYHRASMPNIFQTNDNQQQHIAHLQVNSNNNNNNNNSNHSMSSTRTTPTSTPPPIHIQFNSLPWSQDEQQQQQQTSSSSSNMNSFQQQQHHQQGPPPPVFQRRRFYSQCGLPTPPLQQQQVQSLCPLPMSGIASRRASIATTNDIYTWNRNCENYRQQQEEELEKEPKRARTDEESSDYPVITDADLEAAKKDANAIPRRQKLRFDSDEYTPKWVRYTGQLKEGYCDTCQPGKWLQLKNSAYWYHKQFFHGISSVSGKPFQKPLEQRAGEQDVIEGLCHQCHTFVPICNSKRKNSVLWYRHAHKCHIYDKPKSKGGKRASISSRKYSETPQSIF